MKKIYKHILRFLPLLLIYIVTIVIVAPDGLVADEPRYMGYAENLTQGYYANSENPSIRNGPGYPMVLYLPVLLKAPHFVMRLMNVLFIAVALIYFFKVLASYIPQKHALVLCYIFGLYPPLVRGVTGILSETFAIMLVCGFLYHIIKLSTSSSNSRRELIASGLFLGVLALTKFLFGYVILFLIACLVPIVIFKKSKKIKFGLLSLIIGFSCCLPYLGYTYSVTNKVFLWGTQGGEMLYWRSTPFENEYGDWISPEVITGKIPSKYCDIESLRQNHGEFINAVSAHSALERDRIYKEKAIENIKNHPVKFLKNTLASGFRLFYNYPFTYIPLKTSNFLYIIPNSFLVAFLILGLVLGFYNLKYLAYEIRFIWAFALIYMGGLILLDGRVRHLVPIVPILVFLIAHNFNKFLNIKLTR